MLLRLDKVVDETEQKLKNESDRHIHLQNTLANLQTELLATDSSKRSIAEYASPKKEVDQTSIFDKKASSLVKSDTSEKKEIKKKTDLPIISNDSRYFQPLEISMYEYKFNTPIHISSSSTIIQISGILLVRHNPSKLPNEIKVQMAMKEMDNDANNNVTEIDLRLIKETISPDSSINCILRENSKPELNEYGLPQYQRKLSIALTGTLKNKTIDGLLGWEELSGRPMWARIKIVVTVKEN